MAAVIAIGAAYITTALSMRGIRSRGEPCSYSRERSTNLKIVNGVRYYSSCDAGDGEAFLDYVCSLEEIPDGFWDVKTNPPEREE
jgi:hypothetical protein